jgi:hypothetical protein
VLIDHSPQPQIPKRVLIILFFVQSLAKRVPVLAKQGTQLIFFRPLDNENIFVRNFPPRDDMITTWRHRGSVGLGEEVVLEGQTRAQEVSRELEVAVITQVGRDRIGVEKRRGAEKLLPERIPHDQLLPGTETILTEKKYSFSAYDS